MSCMCPWVMLPYMPDSCTHLFLTFVTHWSLPLSAISCGTCWHCWQVCLWIGCMKLVLNPPFSPRGGLFLDPNFECLNTQFLLISRLTLEFSIWCTPRICMRASGQLHYLHPLLIKYHACFSTLHYHGRLLRSLLARVSWQCGLCLNNWRWNVSHVVPQWWAVEWIPLVGMGNE